MKLKHLAGAIAICMLAAAADARAQLSVLGQFSPGQGTLVGAGFDATGDRVWIYADFAADLRSYSRAGVFQSSIPRPGQAANDTDLEFAPSALVLGTTPLAAGTALFIDGESGAAEIYAVDKSTGAVIATLATAFGASHVVGGAYHPGRNTFFLVQDRQPGGTGANRIAEVNPVTGAVLGSFTTTAASAGFTVNFGDLDISSATGNLFVVSSDESSILELTPTGGLVALHALPSGVSGLSGLAFDELRGEAWVSGGTTVWRLGNAVAAIPEPQTYALLLAGLALLGFARRRTAQSSAY